jgi:hypothetical protein
VGSVVRLASPCYIYIALGGASKVSPVLHSARYLSSPPTSTQTRMQNRAFYLAVMQEIWKPVPSYEGRYEVSNLGRVRSYVRNSAGVFLKPGRSTHGYLTVSLGRKNSRTLHSLVAETFIGTRPAGQEVLHKDGSRTNNCVENLRYGTRSENIRDAVKQGSWVTPGRIEGLIKGRAVRWGHK